MCDEALPGIQAWAERLQLAMEVVEVDESPALLERFGDKVYPATAVLVGRPGELEGFDPERFIYRLESRSE